jgi:hypothetical protein
MAIVLDACIVKFNAKKHMQDHEGTCELVAENRKSLSSKFPPSGQVQALEYYFGSNHVVKDDEKGEESRGGGCT